MLTSSSSLASENAAVSTSVAQQPTRPRPARRVLRLLDALAIGQLELMLPDGEVCRFGGGAQPAASVAIHDWVVFEQVLASGDIGFAEAYLAGQWSTPDLVALLTLVLRNREHLEAVVYGSWWGRCLYRMRHLARRNSRQGSRRNVEAHYDLGNAFYQLWLDPTMNYSSAWFAGNFEQDLALAQRAKVRRALNEVALKPGQRLLEIGCGWGAVAEMAVAEVGAQYTGVTLSPAQRHYAQGRLDGLLTAQQATLRLQDYREIDDAPYDAIVSIEMVEAVGQAYWPTYFAQLARLLKPGGKACIQSIVIRDDLFERYSRSTDFIQQYIFPGGMLPSDAEFEKAARRAGLIVERRLAFGADYAETLRRWRRQFMARDAEVQLLGFDTRFMRTWEFYLAYCEAAFDAGSTDVVQYTLRHAEAQA